MYFIPTGVVRAHFPVFGLFRLHLHYRMIHPFSLTYIPRKGNQRHLLENVENVTFPHNPRKEEPKAKGEESGKGAKGCRYE